ncbi:MAG TPA: hypothetical protein DCL49_04420 [Candidatus Omnitrophica bacterium]|nr:hypothetical protein [Candidatus Omnitrophota bacterium]
MPRPPQINPAGAYLLAGLPAIRAERITMQKSIAGKRKRKTMLTIDGTILPKEVTNLSTDDLEILIDRRYEAEVTQEELNLLETEWEKRVTEEDLSITETEQNIGEGDISGSDLTEVLIKTYYQYITSKDRTGGLDNASFQQKGFWVDIVKEMSKTAPRETITDKQVMEAAKDIYEYKVKLLQRQKVGRLFLVENIICNRVAIKPYKNLKGGE